MNNKPLYIRNEQHFKEFYELQCVLTKLFSEQPCVIKAWLNRLPKIAAKGVEESDKSMHWRATRLNYARRNHLEHLVEDSINSPQSVNALSEWLIKSIPVSSYIEIANTSWDANVIRPDAIQSCVKQLIEYRDLLFNANLVLAYSIARRENLGNFDDRVSDATKGLLDAVDRYVPLEKHVQFSYFATYWIKFQISRGNQKCQSVVAFPINQQRVKAKSEKLQHKQEALGLSPLSYEQIANILHVKLDTVINSYQKPVAISINTSYAHETAMLEWDYALCDPAPEPSTTFDHAELIKSLRFYYRNQLTPEVRVMLSCVQEIGSLSEALFDYIGNYTQVITECSMSG